MPLKIYMTGLFVLLALFSCLAYPARSQTVSCGERSKFLEHLGSKYQESIRAMGIEVTGGVLEVLVSEEGSWTIIRTSPNGQSCVIATGENWENVLALNFGPTA